MTLQGDGREFLPDNRAGRIAQAQFEALHDTYTHKDLGLGPLTGMLRQDAELGRDLTAGVVRHFDGALKGNEHAVRDTLIKFAVGAVIEFGAAMLLGAVRSNTGGSSTGGDGLTALELVSPARESRRFRATVAQEKLIREQTLVRVHYLPESGRILSLEPLSIDPAHLPTLPMGQAAVKAEIDRAKAAGDWYAAALLERRVEIDETPEEGVQAVTHSTATSLLGRWSDGTTEITFAPGGQAWARVNGAPRTGTWSVPEAGRVHTDVLGSARTYGAFNVHKRLLLRAGFSHWSLDRIDGPGAGDSPK